jgi:hypothetical protein
LEQDRLWLSSRRTGVGVSGRFLTTFTPLPGAVLARPSAFSTCNHLFHVLLVKGAASFNMEPTDDFTNGLWTLPITASASQILKLGRQTNKPEFRNNLLCNSTRRDPTMGDEVRFDPLVSEEAERSLILRSAQTFQPESVQTLMSMTRTLSA